MAEKRQYVGALKSSAIIGSASLVTIAIGLVKVKILAVLLGPGGIGLIGFLQNLVSAISTVAGLGVNSVGTRQIAQAVSSEQALELAIVRHALFYSTLFVCLLGFSSFLVIAYFFFSNVDGLKNNGTNKLILALAVLSTIAAASQISLLTGMRRIVDIAKVNVISSLSSAFLGILAVWLLGSSGIAVLVLAIPLSGLLVGAVFLRKLPESIEVWNFNRKLAFQLKTIARLGFVFMLGGAISALAPLAVRTLLIDSLGDTALGEFQAAWQISMLYLGFVLSAMGTDYYPRLTASINNNSQAVEMVNEQTEIAVLLSMPILLLMLGTAPWVIPMLYTNQFKSTASLLSLQILGDSLKVVSWPLGYVLLAAGDGKKFLFAECCGFGSFVIVSWLLIPHFGLHAAGLGFIAMYAVYLPVVYGLARKKIGFKWSAHNSSQIIGLLVSCLCVKAVSAYSPYLGLMASVVLAFVAMCWANFRFKEIKPSGGLIGKLISKLDKK